MLYSVFPSPAYYFLPQWERLAAPYGDAPWGYVALVRYEEAAHALAFLFTLLALAAAWRHRWTVAALLSGAVCLTSWPVCLGLGLVMAATLVAKTPQVRKPKRLPGPLRGRGPRLRLAAFWITPGYMLSVAMADRVVLRHTLLTGTWNRVTWSVLAIAAVHSRWPFWRRISPELAFLLAWLGIVGAIRSVVYLWRQLVTADAASLHAGIQRWHDPRDRRPALPPG
ncbi:MAG: hypothetical protein WDO73_13550 [Ignavibacteriota bacterium]